MSGTVNVREGNIWMNLEGLRAPPPLLLTGEAFAFFRCVVLGELEHDESPSGWQCHYCRGYWCLMNPRP